MCEVQKPQSQFSSTRWSRILTKRICVDCSGDRSCSACSLCNGAAKFTPDEWKKPDGERQCKECVPKRCCKCRKGKSKGQYSKRQWTLEEGRAVCYDCDRKRRGNATRKRETATLKPALTDHRSLLANNAHMEDESLECGLAPTSAAEPRSPLRNSA